MNTEVASLLLPCAKCVSWPYCYKRISLFRGYKDIPCICWLRYSFSWRRKMMATQRMWAHSRDDIAVAIIACTKVDEK